MKENKVLILGIGNYLMGDEGLGVHLAESLSENELPAGIDILDGGTGGFHLLEYFENYSSVILVDATLDKEDIGRIRLIRPKFASDFPRAMSTHDIGMRDLIAALQFMDKIPDVHLFAVSITPEQMQGIELSQEIQKVMPDLRTQVAALAKKLLSEAK
ncbi:hydrogenase maturation protease [Chitinophagaceae bacterium LWZ2-11]